MPQLMPLSWNFSVFIILLIIINMMMLYSYKLYYLKISYNKDYKMKSKVEWWW